jgi:putative Ca2+/H+ antiporter (TMEM165/GDT1 family)
MPSLLMAVYVTVLAAELLGDKSIYTIGSLATRFRLRYVIAGITLAFAAKMAVAVLAGQVLAQLPRGLIATASSLTFFATAFFLWHKRPEEGAPVAASAPRAGVVSFGAIFLTEWADAGQITAAAMTARFGRPLLVWTAATAAMLTKGLLAMLLAVPLRRHVPRSTLRYVALTVCVVMGVLAALRIG